MTEVRELVRAVRAVGTVLSTDGTNINLKPASIVSADLKARLKARKTDVVQFLELEASVERLESAAINIAVWEDGSTRVITCEADLIRVIRDRGTIYSPADMYHYVQLEPHDRHMLHQFKLRF